MKTIAILTDFGFGDNFVGVMKGVILKINSRLHIVDISHGIEPQDIFSAAFLLRSSYKYFPRDTIFLVVVDPGVGSDRRPIIIRSKNYFFIGPDNGVLSYAAHEDGVRRIVVIENKRYFLKEVSDTFHGRDIFAPAAAYLSKGRRLSSFGRALNSVKGLKISKPKINRNTLRGEIIHIDRFGNLVSNIDKHLFQKFTQDKSFTVKIKNRKLNSVARSYEAVRPGQPLAIFGSFNFLEISISGGGAWKRLNADKGTPISITR